MNLHSKLNKLSNLLNAYVGYSVHPEDPGIDLTITSMDGKFQAVFVYNDQTTFLDDDEIDQFAKALQEGRLMVEANKENGVH